MLTVKVFLGKVSRPKIEYFPNWVKLSTTVYCSILITILMLFFSKFLSFIVEAKLFPKLDFLQINKNLVKGYIDMCWLQIWHLQFQLLFQSIFFFFFLANLIPKCDFIYIDWNLAQGYIAVGWLQLACFSKYLWFNFRGQ